MNGMRPIWTGGRYRWHPPWPCPMPMAMGMAMPMAMPMALPLNPLVCVDADLLHDFILLNLASLHKRIFL